MDNRCSAIPKFHSLILNHFKEIENLKKPQKPLKTNFKRFKWTTPDMSSQSSTNKL